MGVMTKFSHKHFAQRDRSKANFLVTVMTGNIDFQRYFHQYNLVLLRNVKFLHLKDGLAYYY